MENTVPPYRCPRCGGTSVEWFSENYYPPGAQDAYDAWKIIDYHCMTCNLREEATDGDPDQVDRFREMMRRWNNPERMKRTP
jgi:hypothetical protein